MSALVQLHHNVRKEVSAVTRSIVDPLHQAAFASRGPLEQRRAPSMAAVPPVPPIQNVQQSPEAFVRLVLAVQLVRASMLEAAARMHRWWKILLALVGKAHLVFEAVSMHTESTSRIA